MELFCRALNRRAGRLPLVDRAAPFWRYRETAPAKQMDSEEDFRSLLLRLFSEQTGLRIDGDAGQRLVEAAQAQMRLLHLPGVAEYLQHARSMPQLWRQLAAQVSNAETYFFRDDGQMRLLEHWLLPDLLRLRRDERQLRLWSAGCASGEEAYSLAMLVDRLLPQPAPAWQITILGSDINPAVISKAEAGLYGGWSMRRVPDEIGRRYFHQHGDQWRLDDRIRRMVRFHVGNLLQPDSMAAGMDLILCRNVFIYFVPEAIRQAAGHLAASLRDGGYLLVGHNELAGVQIPGMERKLFPESLVLQRLARPGRPSCQRPAALPQAAPEPDRRHPIS